MLFYILLLFIFGPIIEWGLHYILHLTNNNIHNNHHKNVTKNSLSNKTEITIELWPLVAIMFCLYNTFFTGAYIFLRYYVIHSIIHFYPEIFPKLTNHHLTHHKYSKYNFCVTSIWPDKLFGTIYKKKIKSNTED